MQSTRLILECPSCNEVMFNLGWADLDLWPYRWNNRFKRFRSYFRLARPSRIRFVATIYVCANCSHQTPVLDTADSLDKLFGEVLGIRKGINYA